MGEQPGWDVDAEDAAAVEERDFVVVGVAVVPGVAFGAGDGFGSAGQEVEHGDAGGLQEQVHGGGQVHGFGGDDGVVGDVEREREVVAAPAFGVAGVVGVEQAGVAAVVVEAHFVFVAAVVVEGAGFGDGDQRGVEREVAAEGTGGWGA